jgi:hypothetical protein
MTSLIYEVSISFTQSDRSGVLLMRVAVSPVPQLPIINYGAKITWSDGETTEENAGANVQAMNRRIQLKQLMQPNAKEHSQPRAEHLMQPNSQGKSQPPQDQDQPLLLLPRHNPVP